MRKSKATEALRVATDIAAIRAALKKRGYTIRKQPKHAAWTVSTSPLAKGGNRGALQADLSASSHQRLGTSSSERQPEPPKPSEHYSTRISQTTHNHYQESLMTYKAQLYAWCIIRPLPNMRSQIVGRFRRRVDAEGHLQILRRLIPSVAYEIMFDITLEDSDSKDLTPPTPLPYEGRGEQNLGSPLKSRRGVGGEVNRGVKPS